MVGAGIRSFAEFCGQMSQIATTGITSWQTALKWAADCQVPCSGCWGQVKPVAIRSQIHISVCGNPRAGYSILGNPRSKRRGFPQSVAHIWARNLARDWIPAPTILHRESPCLKCNNFLAARLLEYKIPTRQIVYALIKHRSQLIHVSRDTIPLIWLYHCCLGLMLVEKARWGGCALLCRRW
jgi:hypothetical protein